MSNKNTMIRRLFGLAIFLSLTGCGPRLFPDRLDDEAYHQPPPHSVHIINAARRSDAASSPPPAPDLLKDPSLSLQQLVASVLERNPDIDSMKAAWEAASSRRAQTSSLDDPTLSYSIAPGSFGLSSIRDGHKVELAQKFPLDGKLDLAGRISQEKAHAVYHDIEAVRQKLIQETTRAFYEYYFVHRAIDINQINRVLLTELQRIAETKYATGTTSKQDVLQAEVERYHLEHHAIELNRRRRVTMAHIALLLHVDVSTKIPAPPKSVAQPLAMPNLITLRAAAVNARPELQSIARKMHAMRLTRQLAAKQYTPDITVMGTYNSMWATTEHQWMIGAGINIPIQTGRRRAAEREAMAGFTRLASELRSRVDRISFEVISAYEMLGESSHVVRLYRDRFGPISEEHLKAARAGYENNKNDFLTLIMAEKNRMVVRLEQERALTAYHRNLADLDRAVGQPVAKFQSDPSTPHHKEGDSK
jgi:cobalt-zinc-cadmium efflux system outer membrane protein